MSHSSSRQIVVGDRGRVVLPSDLRAQFGLEPGTKLLLTPEHDGSLRLRPYRAVADGNLGMLSELAPDRSMVDELLDERRREAQRDNGE